MRLLFWILISGSLRSSVDALDEVSVWFFLLIFFPFRERREMWTVFSAPEEWDCGKLLRLVKALRLIRLRRH